GPVRLEHDDTVGGLQVERRTCSVNLQDGGLDAALLNSCDDRISFGGGGATMDAPDHDTLLTKKRLQAIAGYAINVEDECWRSFLIAAAAAGHHHVLDVGQFGHPVGTPEMGERGAAADHLHQPRHFTLDVRRRDETFLDGCCQRFNRGSNLLVFDTGDRG